MHWIRIVLMFTYSTAFCEGTGCAWDAGTTNYITVGMPSMQTTLEDCKTMCQNLQQSGCDGINFVSLRVPGSSGTIDLCYLVTATGSFSTTANPKSTPSDMMCSSYGAPYANTDNCKMCIGWMMMGKYTSERCNETCLAFQYPTTMFSCTDFATHDGCCYLTNTIGQQINMYQQQQQQIPSTYYKMTCSTDDTLSVHPEMIDNYPSSTQQTGHLSQGAIIGLVVGLVGGTILILLIVILVCCCLIKRERTEEKQMECKLEKPENVAAAANEYQGLPAKSDHTAEEQPAPSEVTFISEAAAESSYDNVGADDNRQDLNSGSICTDAVAVNSSNNESPSVKGMPDYDNFKPA